MQLLSITLTIIGVIFLLAELIIPGGFVLGALGAIVIISSWYMTVLYFKFGFLLVLLEILIISILVYLVVTKIKENNLLNKIVLNHKGKADDISYLENFIGATGITKTTLRPVGNAEFDGILLEVISDNEYIEANTQIKCVKILENKLYVIKNN